MAVNLKLKRKDNKPWGFRLTGGADVHLPVTVIKVKEGSLAEEAGLLVDDVILSINGITTSGLVHEEIHDVIVEAGNELNFVIHRESFKIQELEELTDDVYIDKEVVLQNLRNLQLQSEFEFVTPTPDISDEKIAEVISGESQVLPNQNVVGVNFDNVDLSGSQVLESIKSEQNQVPERKWSTFLQKPKGPRPKPKSKEPELPKFTYNPFKLPKQKVKNDEPSNINENLQNNEKESEINIDPLETDEPETAESIDRAPSEAGEIGNRDSSQNEDHREEQIEDSEEQEIGSVEVSTSEGIKPPEATPSLEEQLAQVQKQLMALQHLPSSIQSTIEAVTQQLAKIASQANQASSYKAESSVAEQQDIKDDDFSDRADSADEDEIKIIQSDKDSIEHEEEIDRDYEHDENENENEIHGDSDSIITHDDDTDEEFLLKLRELTELEKAEMEKEEQKAAKQQKESYQLNDSYQRRIEQRPTRALAPLQRPIVLPGGRKWNQPDDAALSAKPRKMTDEKIAETIETYSEVISGKLKGINFLKYTPPAKNLDYLQNSEVFRLLHEMDPPPRRGIAARPEIIPSVQDIYERV